MNPRNMSQAEMEAHDRAAARCSNLHDFERHAHLCLEQCKDALQHAVADRKKFERTGSDAALDDFHSNAHDALAILDELASDIRTDLLREETIDD